MIRRPWTGPITAVAGVMVSAPRWRVCPDLPQGLGLVDSMAHVRRGRILLPEQKVLLVLDQFEQWLDARRGEEITELLTREQSERRGPGRMPIGAIGIRLRVSLM
jgi:hypothetical protein